MLTYAVRGASSCGDNVRTASAVQQGSSGHSRSRAQPECERSDGDGANAADLGRPDQPALLQRPQMVAECRERLRR